VETSSSVSCSSSSRERSYTWVRANGFRFVGDAGVHGDTGYVPPGARTEEVSESTVPRGLRCDEIKVSSDNGHSLSGIIVSPAYASLGASRSSSSPSESPETLFFYLQGSNPLSCEVYSLKNASRHREYRKPTPSSSRFQNLARSPLLWKSGQFGRRCAEVVLEINAHSSL